MSKTRRVFVTGIGLVTPLGVGVEANWRRLVAGACGIRRVPSLQGLPTEIGATVPRGSAPDEFELARCALARPGDESGLSPFIHFALAAADEAMSGWSPRDSAEMERAGVAIGSGIGSLTDIVEASAFLSRRGHRRISPHFIPKMLVNMAAGQVSIRTGLQGPSASPSTACATGVHALSDALQLVRRGAADVMLAGGAEACLEPLAVAVRASRSQTHDSTMDRSACLSPGLLQQGFCRARALATGLDEAPQRASRPFDAGRAGFVMGEGAGVLLLESEEHALARGAAPLAELRAVGLSSDAHHITAPPGMPGSAARTPDAQTFRRSTNAACALVPLAEDGCGALRAMRAALSEGGVSPGEVHLLEPRSSCSPTLISAHLASLSARPCQRACHLNACGRRR